MAAEDLDDQEFDALASAVARAVVEELQGLHTLSPEEEEFVEQVVVAVRQKLDVARGEPLNADHVDIADLDASDAGATEEAKPNGG